MVASALPIAGRRAGGIREWLVPAGLVLLSLVPVVAGVLRVAGLATGVAPTSDNARFLAAPVPLVAHVVGAVPYCVLGAFQFASVIRRRWPGWHRNIGRLLIPGGLVVALSGIWMTVSYDLPAFDGALLNGSRLVLGAAMAVFLVLGVVAVRRRDFTRHRAWMIRAYAIALGAGTQVLTHLPLVIAGVTPGVGIRTVAMLAGWLINLAVAEWAIRRRRAVGAP